jgi:alanyl-tRNA synthetase
MTGAEARKSFLDYFEQRGHLIVPSAPIIPVGDATLMFTNAGMVQFKDVFLGLAKPPAARVADSQKCLRISGKHNDLEEVGRDTYHHTLFEMLGNWSFADYYKPEAIEWAWDLLVRQWGLPAERLYATVYRTDDEAEALWRKISGLPAERVMRFAEKDNFWEMGDTGPCGPCSEIHIDRGPGSCDMQHVSGHVCGVNVGCSRFLELWNLVFIQYTRDESGKLHELPAKHVDTGMGLERVAAVLEKVDGNYAGSLLRGIITAAEKASGREYGRDPELDISFRVLADHGRAVSFMIADGIEPSNEGRGYVLRRLLRRAARHGKNIGFEHAFFFKICERVVDGMSAAYPELASHRARILDVVRAEEERFQSTLGRGLVHLEEEVQRLGVTIARDDQEVSLPGDVAFRLYDTYGFPIDMTEDILRSRGIRVDRAGFDAALDAQRERAREAQAGRLGAADYTLLVGAARKKGGSTFAGSFVTRATSEILAMSSGGELRERAKAGDEVDLVTATTPFYGESGGQVGDIGTIVTPTGARMQVLDTQKPAPDVIVHRVRVLDGDVATGDGAELEIDAERRQAIRLNHSSTHLLHAALRNHLGTGVQQAGSLVEAPRLRFDFSHDGPVADEKLVDIEAEVNAQIRTNLKVEDAEMPYREAIAAGALAFFGEKYGDVVRIVKMGDYSVELCGGTHVARTGDIGLLQIYSEGGIAAGVRRVEASTGAGALDRVRRRDTLLREVARVLRAPETQAVERLEKLLAEVKILERKLERGETHRSADAVEQAIAQAKDVGGAKAVFARVDGIDARQMRALSDRVRERIGSGVVLLVAATDSGASLTVGVTPDMTGRFHAGDLVRALAPLIDGRGGGKPDFAQAGGKNPAGIAALLEKAHASLVG